MGRTRKNMPTLDKMEGRAEEVFPGRKSYENSQGPQDCLGQMANQAKRKVPSLWRTGKL